MRLPCPITSRLGGLWLSYSITTRLARMWLNVPKHIQSQSHLAFFLLMHDSILLASHVTVKWSDTLEIGYPYVHSQYSTVLLPTVFCVQCMREMESTSLVLGFDRSITSFHVRYAWHTAVLWMATVKTSSRSGGSTDPNPWKLYQLTILKGTALPWYRRIEHITFIYTQAERETRDKERERERERERVSLNSCQEPFTLGIRWE